MQNSSSIHTLLVYSPPYNGSDFFGHLVEHCICEQSDSSIQQYFDFHQSLDVRYCHNLFSKTKIPHFMHYETVLDQFKKPLSNKIITREIWVLRDELSDGRDQEELLADQVSNFIWFPIHSKNITRVNYVALKKYHEQYYINGSWVLMDDINNRVHTNIQKYHNGAVKYATWKFMYRVFRPKWYKYLVLIVPTKHPYTAMFVEFISWLIDYWEVYSQRYTKAKYHYRDYDTSYVLWYMYIWISHLNDYTIDKDFFDIAKEYFLEKERLVNGRYMVRVREILNQQLLDDTVVHNFFKTLQYEEVMKVIQKLQSLQ